MGKAKGRDIYSRVVQWDASAAVLATSAWRHAGNLRFANVVSGDELSGVQPYVCVLSNDLLRSLVQGEDQRIVPQRVTGARPTS